MLQGEFVTEEHIQIYSCSIEMFPFFLVRIHIQLIMAFQQHGE